MRKALRGDSAAPGPQRSAPQSKKTELTRLSHGNSVLIYDPQQASKAKPLNSLANVGSSRNIRTELHRGLFTTASAERNGQDGGSKNDSALHSLISCVCSNTGTRTLASHIRGGRNLGTELHRRFFTTASADRKGDDGSRKNDQPLNSLHGLFS
jgi:hypothetical protein